MSKRKKPEQLDSNRSQWICKFCQRIYYSVTLDEFNSDNALHHKQARESYSKSHHCSIKDRIFSKGKTNANVKQSNRT